METSCRNGVPTATLRELELAPDTLDSWKLLHKPAMRKCFQFKPPNVTPYREFLWDKHSSRGSRGFMGEDGEEGGMTH